MAKCTPSSSRPGTGRSRGTREPSASTTASYSSRSSSALTSTPTSTPRRSSPPSSTSCCTRRSTIHFSILKSGTPKRTRPPAASSRSNSVTACPSRRSCCAAAMPAGPLPTTATDMPVSCCGGCGTTQPSDHARLTIAFSICLIVTASPSRISSTHDASHGAGHRRPVNSGKLFVACSWRIASSQRPRYTRSFQSGIRLPSGQPLWQNGTPHSMHRAPCSASSVSGRCRTNSLKSLTRSSGARSGTPTRWTFTKARNSPIERHLLGRVEALAADRDGLLRRLFLLLGELLEHAAVVLGKHLDELRCELVPLVEHPPADRRVGARDVLGDEVAHLDRIRLVHRAEVLDVGRVDLGAEGPVLVEHERQAAAHAGGEVAPGRPEDDDAAAGHVLAAVVADRLDDGDRAGVADAEALAGDAAEERLALRRAVQRDVADHHVVLGLERRVQRRAHRERPPRHAPAPR